MTQLADGVELGTTTASGATDIAGLSLSAGYVHLTDWFTVGATAPVADHFEYELLDTNRKILSREVGYMSANASGVVNIKRERCIYNFTGGSGSLLLNNPSLPTLVNGTQYYVQITGSAFAGYPSPSNVRSTGSAKRIICNAAMVHKSGGTNKSLVANTVYSNRFLLKPTSIPILGCQFGFSSAGATATKARMALSAMNPDGTLGRLLFETADITGFGTTGEKETAWSTTGRILPPGEYIIHIITDGTLAVIANPGDASLFDHGPNSLGCVYNSYQAVPCVSSVSATTFAGWTTFAGIGFADANLSWSGAGLDTVCQLNLMG